MLTEPLMGELTGQLLMRPRDYHVILCSSLKTGFSSFFFCSSFQVRTSNRSKVEGPLYNEAHLWFDVGQPEVIDNCNGNTASVNLEAGTEVFKQHSANH